MQPKSPVQRIASLLVLCAFAVSTVTGAVAPAHAAATATITVTTALDHADLVAADNTANGVCTDTVRFGSGLVPVPVFGCSLRSALKTAFETPESDTIVFTPALNGVSFALKGAALNWAASGVLVDAQGQTIVLNGAAMNAGVNMIEIGGSSNTLRGVSLTAARANALVVGDQAGVGAGNDNRIEQVKFFGNVNGIAASIVGSGAPGGARNAVVQSEFGVPAASNSCEPARANSVNIRVANGAVSTNIHDNLIMCGDSAGVQVLSASTSRTVVQSNRIGVGLNVGDNWPNGVGIAVQDAQHTTITANLIRANLTSGISVRGAGTNNMYIGGNAIGDIDRGAPFGIGGENISDGILIDGVTRLDGTIESNSINGNGRDGIRVNASGAITITTNTIGYEDASFNARNVNGVHVLNGSQRVYVLNNTIGYNENIGVWITGENSDNNGVAGNTIVGQGNSGVQIDGGADFNAIGARAYGLLGIFDVSGNTIISNTREGIYVAGATTTFNLIAANEIGQQSKFSYPNGMNGIVLAGARDTLIGGDVSGLSLRNTVVNNGGHGLLLIGAQNTTVHGNAFGYSPALAASSSGDGASPNGGSGIYLDGAATGNSIGGGTFGQSNTASHNAADGITLQGAGVTNNTIGGNQVDKNSANGLAIYAATSNIVAGSAANPLSASGNTLSGIYLATGANNNTLSQLNLDANRHYGLLIDNSTGNTVGNAMSTGNGFDGIGERNSATNNSWSQLSTLNNGGLGIDKDANADNTNVVAANTVTITAYTVGDGNMSLAGLSPSTSYEVYLAAADPSGHGEGARVSVAFSTGAGASTASVNIPADDRANNCFTVLKTNAPASEFSQNYCRLAPQSIAFAPADHRTLAQPLSFTQYATATSALPVGYSGLTPGVCMVTAAGVVAIITTGVCNIRLEQPGDAAFGPATPVIISFNVTKASQTISPYWAADVSFGSGPQTYAVNASSGLPVSLASTTPDICTVSGSVMTPVAVGLCNLVATQPGNATYNAAMPINISIPIVPGAQTITFAQPGDVGVNAGTRLTASATSGLPVSFGGGTPGVCVVAADGRITPLGIGMCSVTASQPGNTNYAAAAPVTRSFAIRFVTLLPLMRRI
jgi:hypothetical protein